MTAMRWCDEEFSGVTFVTPENSPEAIGLDGKDYPSERLSPEDLAERRRLAQELRNAGYTLEEIAEELGVSLGTAELYPGRGVKNLASAQLNCPDPPAAQNFDFRGPPIFWGNDFHHRRSRGELIFFSELAKCILGRARLPGPNPPTVQAVPAPLLFLWTVLFYHVKGRARVEKRRASLVSR